MLIIRLIKWIFGKYKRDNLNFFGQTGAIKDKKDRRDYIIGSLGLDLPKEINLKEYVKEVKAQGIQNSCVAHAICSSIELQLQLDNPKRHMPLSERYNYYYGRKESNLFPENQGMYPRDAIKSAKKDGISREILCPYNYGDMNKKPSMIARSIAHIYGVSINQYYRAFSKENIKEQLMMGLPVIIAVPIYDYWILNKSGNIRLPRSTDRKIGFHAILIVGYFEGYFICLNSWSFGWGNKGFCNIPMNYARTDSWVIELK